jgi:phage terminase large subunit-like protein
VVRYPYNTLTELDRVTAYAVEVVEGRAIAGLTQRQACERHLKDIERQNTKAFPYYFDPNAAHELIEFAESLTLAEGDDPAPLELWGFQDFIFGSWNGWKTSKGYRRFRTSYIQVARQNGKSLKNAVPAMYYGNFAGYNYPQVYTAATKELQAKIVLKEAIKFIDADDELCNEHFTVKEYKGVIECNISRGEIRALGRDTKSIDGFRPYFASVDEYHLHKDNQMYKLLSDGTKKLKECLVSVITTAGFDLDAPCYGLYNYCKDILAGLVVDESQFVFICELDKDDDEWDEANWQKANPLWTEQTLESLQADAVKAKSMQGEELRNFLTKSLNKWVKFAENDYLNREHWAECKSETDLEDYRGRDCWLGFDLSSGGDLTSLVFEIDAGGGKYFIHSQSFMPSKRVAEHIKSDKVPYDMWIKKGLLTVTETMGGVKTDYKYIIAYLKELIEKYDLNLREIGYDPHNADAFLSDLEEFGVDCVEIVQSAKSLNDSTVDFRLEVEAGHIMYNEGADLLMWSGTNAKTVFNSFGEMKIEKGEPGKRIDPIAAAICAHKVMIRSREDRNPYEDRGFISF